MTLKQAKFLDWGTLLIPTRLAIVKRIVKQNEYGIFLGISRDQGVKVAVVGKLLPCDYSPTFWQPEIKK